MTHSKIIFSITSGCRLLAAMIVLTLSSACERNFSLDSFRDKDTDDLLVVNAILNPDSLMKVSVTHPFFFSEPHTYFPPVRDLEVMISEDGVDWSRLDFDPVSGLYVADDRPHAGCPVRLQVVGSSNTQLQLIPSLIK